MATYTQEHAGDLLPDPQRTPNSLKFIQWLMAIFEYFFSYTNHARGLNSQILSGQTGVLLHYIKTQIGVDVEIKDYFGFEFFPYRSPYDCQIIIDEGATLSQYDAIVELFNFYRLAGKKFIFKYGKVITPGSDEPWVYFEFGLGSTPEAESFQYFEFGF
jgi:hypothetical protein